MLFRSVLSLTYGLRISEITTKNNCVFIRKLAKHKSKGTKFLYSRELGSCLCEEIVIFISKLFYSMRFAKREFADRMIGKKNMCKHISREILN